MSRAGGRGYATSEYDYDYDDREYTTRSRGGNRGRDYDEVDVSVRTRDSEQPASRRGVPDYLREDYGRNSNAGQMVVRERKSEDFRDFNRSKAPTSRGRNDDYYEEEDLLVRTRSRGPPQEDMSSVKGNHGTKYSRRDNDDREEVRVDVRSSSRGPPPSRYREEEDVSVNFRDGPAPSRSRGYDDDIVFRRGSGDRPSKSRGRGDEEDIVIKRDEYESTRSRQRDNTRVEVDIRDDEGPRRGPPPRSSRGQETDEVDVSIRTREGERSRAPERTRDETLVVRERSRSRAVSRGPPGTRPVAREREEFVYRRRSPSPPPPQPYTQTQEITIRQTKSPSPESSPSPPPPPPAPEPITRPPIVQEVITHHRHIDHGFERAPPSESSSSPSPPPRRRNSGVEVDIRRTDSRGNVTEEDIKIQDRESRSDRSRSHARSERAVSRKRSVESVKSTSQALAPIPPPAPPQQRRENINIDVNVDNGNPDRRVALPTKPPPPREMWTEVTKDLVSREAIREMGYQFEESDDFFYVMEYLRYEDVMRLVQVSEDLHRARRDRIGQIQWERRDPHLQPPPGPRPGYGVPPSPRRRGPGPWDEEIYEREVIYDDRPPRRPYR